MRALKGRALGILLVVAMTAGVSPARGAISTTATGGLSDAVQAELAAGLRHAAAGHTASPDQLRQAAALLRAPILLDASVPSPMRDLVGSAGFRQSSGQLADLAEQLAASPSTTKSFPPELGDEIGLATEAALLIAGFALNAVLFAPLCTTNPLCYVAVVLTFAILSAGVVTVYGPDLAFALLDETLGAVDDITDILQCTGLIILFPDLAVQCAINVITGWLT
jgi:hypothetical protein